MVITRKLKLYPPNTEKLSILKKTAELQTKCVNFWVDKIREIESTNLKELQARFYREARNRFGLGSVLTQCAEMVAIRISRTVKRKRKESPYLKNQTITTNTLKVDGNNLIF